MLTTEQKNDLREFLPTHALFGGIEGETLERIIDMLVPHDLPKGAEVCVEGEMGRSMYVVRRGQVVVLRTTPSGRRVRVVRLGPGEFFGEMTLIDIQKRSATVRCEEPSLLYSLENKDLYRLYQTDVAGYVMVIQNLCRELSRRLRTTNSRLTDLAAASGDERTQIGIPAVGRKKT